MQRWSFTVGLSALFLIAAAIAPRQDDPPAPTPPAKSDVNGTLPEIIPPPSPVPSEGILTFDARLDQHAVLLGKAEERYIAVTVTAPPDVGVARRHPVDLGVVIDTSGSMAARGKMDYARKAAEMLATEMEPTDIYSLVAFSDHARVIVEAQHVLDRSAILTKIDGIFEQGGTNLHAGLELGAQQVRSELAGGARGRIVLLSDGHANVGITSPSAFIRQASELSSKGISVSAIGLGLDYNEDTLASIADAGGGTYGYVADPADLVDVFTEELSRTAAMVARELRVDLTFAEGVQPIEVLGWSSSVADDTWTVSMGDINAGETRQLIAKVRIQGEVEGEIPILSLGARYRDLTTDKLATVSIETSAQVTQSAAIVKASTDLEAAQQATRAWGNWYLDQSARAFADGDASHAQDLANQASVVLRQGATTFASPEMLEDAVQCDEAAQTYASAPLTSDEAKHVIKKSKEQFRVRARH